MRIAILDDIHGAWEGTDGVRRLRERAEVKIFTEPFGSAAALRGFDALVANRERTKFTRALLEQLVDLRVIAQTGNHAAHMDFAAAQERGIVVAQASGGYSIGAAELSIGLAIAVMRQLPRYDAAVRRGEWHTPLTPVLHGKTFGAIGLGRVGTHVARVAGHEFDDDAAEGIGTDGKVSRTRTTDGSTQFPQRQDNELVGIIDQFFRRRVQTAFHGKQRPAGIRT